MAREKQDDSQSPLVSGQHMTWGGKSGRLFAKLNQPIEVRLQLPYGGDLGGAGGVFILTL